jgi:hypothetical protein
MNSTGMKCDIEIAMRVLVMQVDSDGLDVYITPVRRALPKDHYSLENA